MENVASTLLVPGDKRDLFSCDNFLIADIFDLQSCVKFARSDNLYRRTKVRRF